MNTRVNWLAATGGIATLLLAVVSLYVPWWRFTVGQSVPGSSPLAEMSFSPVNLNFSISGIPLDIPLIWALNMIALLSLITGGAILLVYAFKPDKSYSKKLLGYGYNKPAFALVFFVVELILLSVIAKMALGFDVPMVGTSNVQLPQIVQGVAISATVTAGFEWPFFLSIPVAAICLSVRLFHKRLVKAPLLLSAQPEIPQPPQV